MKELNDIVLEKRLFASIKGQLCLTKEHLSYQEGHVEFKYPKAPIPPPSSEVPLDTFDSIFFLFKKGIF